MNAPSRSHLTLGTIASRNMANTSLYTKSTVTKMGMFAAAVRIQFPPEAEDLAQLKTTLELMLKATDKDILDWKL